MDLLSAFYLRYGRRSASLERSKGSGFVLVCMVVDRATLLLNIFVIEGVSRLRLLLSTYSRYHNAGVLLAKQPTTSDIPFFLGPRNGSPSLHVPDVTQSRVGGRIRQPPINPCLLERHQKDRIERQAKSSLGSRNFQGYHSPTAPSHLISISSHPIHPEFPPHIDRFLATGYDQTKEASSRSEASGN
jgi:hypothetical protein